MENLRISLKNIVRQPKKFFLFSLLIFLISLFGCLGISIWSSANDMIRRTDDIYTTKATVTYVGGKNISEAWGDENLQKTFQEWADEAGRSKDVVSVNHVVQGMAGIKDMENDALEYVKNKAMVKCKVFSVEKEVIDGTYELPLTVVTAIVEESYYGNLKKDQYFVISTQKENGDFWLDEWKKGGTYFVYGELGKGNYSFPVLNIKEPSWYGAELRGEDLSDLVPITEISKLDAVPKQELWMKFADTLKRTSDLHEVYALNNALLWDEFYTGLTNMEEGEAFKDAKENACIISDRFAKKHMLKLGDELPLKFYYNETGESREVLWSNEDEGKEDIYQVTGIYKYQEELKNAIFISSAGNMGQNPTDNHILQIQLKNGTGEHFVKKYAERLPEDLVITLEDQGYDQAVLPIKSVYRQAVMLTCYSILLGFIVLWFISRNFYKKEAYSVEILKELGCGKRERLIYLAGGQFYFVTAGTVLGYLVQLFLTKSLLLAMIERSYNKYVYDLRFSQLSSITKIDFTENIKVNPWMSLILILILELISVCMAVYHIREKRRLRRGGGRKIRQELMPQYVSKKGTWISSFSIRFGIQEFFRNKKQSTVFIMVAFILMGAMGVIQIIQQRQLRDLAYVNQEMEIQGYITSLSQRSKENMALDFTATILPIMKNDGEGGNNPIDCYEDFKLKLISDVYWKDLDRTDRFEKSNKLYHDFKRSVLEGNPYISDFGITKRVGYEYMGKSAEAKAYPNNPFHSDQFGNDWLLNKIPSMNQIVFGDSLQLVSNAQQILDTAEYIYGYDDRFMEGQDAVCMVSDIFLTENELYLGDNIRIASYTELYGPRVAVLDAKIIGTYEGVNKKDIYMPISNLYGSYFLYDLSYEFYEQQVLPELRDIKDMFIYDYYGFSLLQKVSSFRFVVADNGNIDSTRELLKQVGYSEKYRIGGLRQRVVLEDGAFLHLIQAMQMHIDLLNIISYVFLVLTVVMIAAISAVSILQVKGDIFLMVELGTMKRKIIQIWFIRYGFAAVCGILPAVIIIVTVCRIQHYELEMKLILLILAEFLLTILAALYISITKIVKNTSK